MKGAQRPRVSHVPPFASSAGEEAIELAAMAGLHLDPWEKFVLANALNEREDGLWSAFEVGLMVSRQNGKGAILEARELAGLFLLGERLIIHSAHLYDTSLEAMRRLLDLIEATPEFDRRVQHVSKTNGKEAIELKGGQRIRFRTRTKGGGRGFTGDCLVLDEAMDIPEAMHGALLPTLSARPNPQVWYTGSAVDQWTHDNGVVFARIRQRGLAGDDPELAYFDWSLAADSPTDVDGEAATDVSSWAQANPSLGIRISPRYVAAEQRSMDPRTFAVERLGVGDWPETDEGGGWSVIAADTWGEILDADSVLTDPVCFAVDVTPDRSWAAIGVAGRNTEGHGHVEVIEHKRGTHWVVERLAGLLEKHESIGVVLDGASPAASLLPKFAEHDIEPQMISGREYAQACGLFYDAADEQAFRHLDDADLGMAVKGAVKRPLGDAWAWSRKTSSVDISPLVAVTLALWGHASADDVDPNLYRLEIV